MDDIPRHIGIILDGNRRWARTHAFEIALGHTRGMDNLTRIVRHCSDRGVACLTVYGFSIENWQRTDEVGHLMRLFERYARDKQTELAEQGIRVRVLGDTGRLPASLRSALDDLCAATRQNRRFVLALCLSYSGRDEIVRSVRRLTDAGLAVTEQAIADHLDSAGLPDPDLIIRTSGEQRLSNFLTWQSTYSELYFSPVLWPDFDEAELDRAIAWYGARERRHGA